MHLPRGLQFGAFAIELAHVNVQVLLDLNLLNLHSL
jgi:hypothetical protein